MMLIGGGANVLSGVVGHMMGEGDRNRARMLIEENMKRIDAIPLPDTEKMKLVLQLPEVQGVLRPYQEKAAEMGPSAFENLMSDPALGQKQRRSLDLLEEVAQEGLTDVDRLALNELRDKIEMDRRAERESILQNMAARGVTGAGQELATKLTGMQSSANEAKREADRIAAMKQQARRGAIMQSGQLAGEIAQQEFNRDATRAGGLDAYDQFAAQLEAGREARNVDRQTHADTFNLQNQQRVAELRSAIQNQQQMHNKQLEQQQFQNQLAKEAARAGQAVNMSNVLADQAASTGQMWAGIGQGIGQVTGGMMAHGHKYQKPNTIGTSSYTQPKANWRDAFNYDDDFDPYKV